MVEVFEKIRTERNKKGYSQEFMADSLNLSQKAYSRLESGETEITWNKIGEIAEVLEIDPLYLTAKEGVVFNNCNYPQSGVNHTINVDIKTAELLKEVIETQKNQNTRLMDILEKLGEKLN